MANRYPPLPPNVPAQPPLKAPDSSFSPDFWMIMLGIFIILMIGYVVYWLREKRVKQEAQNVS
jgi:hypothetical protein